MPRPVLPGRFRFAPDAHPDFMNRYKSYNIFGVARIQAGHVYVILTGITEDGEPVTKYAQLGNAAPDDDGKLAMICVSAGPGRKPAASLVNLGDYDIETSEVKEAVKRLLAEF